MIPEIKALVEQSNSHFEKLTNTINRIPEEKLFLQVGEKWSPAQHLQHLIIATRTSTAAFALPKFIVRLIGGKVSGSRSYDNLVTYYQQLLVEGAKASGRYIPRGISSHTTKEALIIRWNQATHLYIEALSKQKKMDSLETIAVKHPILKKISLLELAYFTIYHTEHHCRLIVQ